MASENRLMCGEDYQDLFDCQAYLSAYYKQPEGPYSIEFYLESLHEIYKEGKITGRRILDIGSGPNIHMMIPAGKWFDEVFLSDYSRRNRETLQIWLDNDTTSHDWQPFYRYFARKDGNEDNWHQYEQILRRKVKGILSCDVFQQNPLFSATTEQFDVVCSSLCLESAAKDLDQYKIVMKNVVSLLPSGGFFILIGVLNSRYYFVGSDKFFALPLNLPFVLETVKDAGMEVVRLFRDENRFDGEEGPFAGCFVLLAKKS